MFKHYYAVLYLFWVILPWPVVTAFIVISKASSSPQWQPSIIMIWQYHDFFGQFKFMITGLSIDSTQSSGLPKTMISSMIYPNFDHMGIKGPKVEKNHLNCVIKLWYYHNISIKEVLGKMKTSLIIKYLIKIHKILDQNTSFNHL